MSSLLNRRHLFIQGSTAASLVVAPRLGQAMNAANDRVRVAFIGTGNQGMGLLKRVLQHDLAQVVAACDVNRGSYGYKKEEHFYGREPAAELVNQHYSKHHPDFEKCVAVNEHERVLERDDIDAVFIVVPDHSHRAITLEAADAGKHVYCEKPLSHSIAGGRSMVTAMQKSGRIGQTGSQERSNPVSAFVCNAVKDGLVGDLRRIVTKVGFNNKVGPGPGWDPMPVPDGFDYQRWLGSAPKLPFHQDRCLYRFRFHYDYSGGQITNFGAHCNDMAHWGMGLDQGAPETIECLDAKFLPEGSLFNTATETRFRATYANGVELICESGPESVQTRFEGTQGWIQTGYKGTTASDPSWLEGLPTKIDEAGMDPHSRHMANFIESIRGNATPQAPFETGHHSANLCHLANVVIKRFPEHGREKLMWDGSKGRFQNSESANQMLSI
ncbi:MAG: Gfo/Idh/MocA family oxidoreductase [Planctomycetota bacterium]